MKKIYTLSLVILASVASFAQTFYSENVGTATGTLAIAANTFQNAAPIVYSGDADTRSTLATGAYTGASQGRNVFITNTIGKFFQIDGLNSSAYSTADIQLSFGINTSSVTSLIIVEQSTNGTNWTPLTFTPTGTGWTLVTIAGGQIPSSATLSLRFKQPDPVAGQTRIDDIKLSNVSASCLLSIGATSTLCDAFTTNLDTYSASIGFTGGGQATYVVTPSSGTVSGDNPSTTASGTINIIGVAEGTALNVTITGGTCNFSVDINAANCKAINTLPLIENFSYATDSALTANQRWSSLNSGDAITVASGSLNYSGVNSAGNSASFTGDGAEAETKFTPTNSGTIYSSFLMNVTENALVTTDLTQTVFAYLTDGGSGFNVRLFVKKSGTQYLIGCTSATTGTDAIYGATAFNLGDVVAVVVGHDFAINELKMWLNPTFSSFTSSTPATITETPATAFTTLGGFILRQDSNTSTPTILFDELRVSTTTAGLLNVQSNEIYGLNIYPNPVTNGTLFIDTKLNADKNISIYNVLGKEVLNTTTASNAVNVSKLSAGVYVVKVIENGSTATRKLVIR